MFRRSIYSGAGGQFQTSLPEKSAVGDLKATTNCVLVAENLFPEASVTVNVMEYFPGVV